MVGAAGREQQTKDVLAGFETMDIDLDVAERAAELRRQHRIKLPDAIIWATARALDLDILVPYELR